MRLDFDRGTIVLRGVPPELSPRQLPGWIWDPRVNLYRAPAFRYGELTQELALRGIPAKDCTRPDGRGRPPEDDRWSTLDLRPYQSAALASWDLAGRRGVLVLPTGSGKTRVALAAMASAGVGRPGGVWCLCLVPTRVLLTQWQAEIKKVWPGKVGLWGDGAREMEPVTVMTFESAYRHMSRLGNRFDLLIVDEAHHFGLGPQDEALEMSTARRRLGLTATLPPCESRVKRLTQILGPVVYELSVGDLAGRYLAPFDLITVTVAFSREDGRRYRSLLSCFRPYFQAFFGRSPEAGWEDLCRAARQHEAGTGALVAWRKARMLAGFHQAKAEMLHRILGRHRSNRLLVFTGSNEAAYAVARSELILPITCDIGRAERADALALFSSGALRALVSSQVLNEGIDVPEAEIAVILGGTGAEREHVQRVGRLLRPLPGKRALVYEIVTRGTAEVQIACRRRIALNRRTGGNGKPAFR